MRYEIVLLPEAIQDLKRLTARDATSIRDALERHLRSEPQKVSKSRIKRLKRLSHPQYRLRVDDFRVYYDVADNTVYVLAVVS
jgi:mRNA-degrading endonuclease RelE of RelBE toxin-antitoxin system